MIRVHMHIFALPMHVLIVYNVLFSRRNGG